MGQRATHRLNGRPRETVDARFDVEEARGWAAATGVLWGLSYFFWRRLQATPASA